MMPYTLDQLEAFVSSPHYDAATADLIARGIPAFPRAKEQLAKGISRIRGNLCNVHGKYGPCDKGLEADGIDPSKPPPAAAAPAKPQPKPKPAQAKRGGAKKPKPKATPAKPKQAAAQQNVDNVAKRMADSDTGLSPSGVKALTAFADGAQPDADQGAGLAKMGLAERANDGSYRMTAGGRSAVSAMRAGDYQKAVDAISQSTDAQGTRAVQQTSQQERTANAAKRQQDAAGKRVAAQAGRDLAKRQAAEQAKKKPAKASADDSKKPEIAPAEKPRRAPRPPRNSGGGSTAASGSPSATPKPATPKPEQPEKAPAKQIAPALQDAAQQLSDGAELSDDDTQSLIRNGLAKLDKNGALVLTTAGMRATTKSFRVFKDANGKHRWVAQSSTAFQDRDKEIVSTKALSDDCVFADKHDAYGPLRWWHTPGLDLGDCDFNAMHGRVLFESGTFRSATIAQKVARAADGLEISLGFIHLPTEPDADGVFHHIRRFERSLVPRGKASNRFTAFAVKESRMFEPTKVAALKTLGFGDDEIAALQAQAAATEKAATDQGVAFKADEPEYPDVVLNGITYKAFPPKKDEEALVEAVVETDAFVEEVVEEEAPADANALTLSAGDIAAISEAIQQAVATIMGGLDLEKKVASHVQGFLQPMQQAQATKDAAQAAQNELVEELTLSVKDAQSRLAELTGDQAVVPYRASAAKDNVLSDATMLAAAKQLNDPNANDPWADIKLGLGLTRPQ